MISFNLAPILFHTKIVLRKCDFNEEDDDIKTPTAEELSFPASIDGPKNPVSIY